MADILDSLKALTDDKVRFPDLDGMDDDEIIPGEAPHYPYMDVEPLNEDELEELCKDWIEERDGDLFVHVTEEGRAELESAEDELSTFALAARSMRDLLIRAYPLMKEVVTAMNPPKKVSVRLVYTKDSFTQGTDIVVSTAVLDDETVDTAGKLKVLMGLCSHETAHCKYTDFDLLNSRLTIEKEISGKMVKVSKSKLLCTIQNVVEDEYIEKNTCKDTPKMMQYLASVKYWYFDVKYVEETGDMKLNPFEECYDAFFKFVRYPKYLDKEILIKYGRILMEVKEALTPYPNSTEEALNSAEKIEEIFVKYFPEDMMRSAETDGFMEAVASAMGGYSEDKGFKPEMSKDLEKDKILGKELEGDVIRPNPVTIFLKEKDNKEMYMDSYKRISKFVAAVSRELKGHNRDYKLIHRGMRSGMLDTNKLAEAVQGVQSVYIKAGHVKTDSIALVVAIDESGSMSGSSERSARDTAILIREAIKRVGNVDLYIYGHSADQLMSGMTEMYIYEEPGSKAKFSLGSSHARYENRDGYAIKEIAEHVRRKTSKPVLMFVLSDGAPCAHGYGGSKGAAHVKSVVTNLEKSKNFRIIQVAINHSYDPATMFKHYLILDDLNTLAKDLGTVVKKAIQSMAHIQIS